MSTNKGCARRPQRLPAWGKWEQEGVEVGYLGRVEWGEWEQEVVGAGADVNVRVCVEVDVGA